MLRIVAELPICRLPSITLLIVVYNVSLDTYSEVTGQRDTCIALTGQPGRLVLYADFPLYKGLAF